jgi:hypothetical protein
MITCKRPNFENLYKYLKDKNYTVWKNKIIDNTGRTPYLVYIFYKDGKHFKTLEEAETYLKERNIKSKRCLDCNLTVKQSKSEYII